MFVPNNYHVRCKNLRWQQQTPQKCINYVNSLCEVGRNFCPFSLSCIWRFVIHLLIPVFRKRINIITQIPSLFLFFAKSKTKQDLNKTLFGIKIICFLCSLRDIFFRRQHCYKQDYFYKTQVRKKIWISGLWCGSKWIIYKKIYDLEPGLERLKKGEWLSNKNTQEIIMWFKAPCMTDILLKRFVK